MKMQRIRVEQLRQFRQPLAIDGLSDGINLFTGPNESGKSTLVRAIRAAFFERYKSSSVDDLQPWGDSSAAPEVEVEFLWQGERWHLIKSFLKKKRCDLQVGTRSLSGEDAEDKLAELLGFQYAGRGASKPEHWGVPGLLWIEQGAGQDVQQAVRDAGNHLKSALGGTLGDLASSAGDDLIAQLDAERGRLLTATGRPTLEYKTALEEKAALESRVQALDEQVANYAQQVDRLAQLRADQLEDQSKPWLQYRREAAQATERLREVESLERDQAREQQALESCRESQAMNRQQLDEFTNQQHQLQRRKDAHRQAVETEKQLRDQDAAIRQQVENAEDAYKKAVDRARLARQKEQKDRLQNELDQVKLRLEEKQGHLSEAQKLLEQIRQQRVELSTIAIDNADLKRLKGFVEKRQRLEIEEKAVATRLEYHLLPDKSLLLGSQTLQGQGEQVLLEPATLEIPGVGQVLITPGGKDLADLARQRQQLGDNIEQAMTALKVNSLTEAEQRAEDARRLGADIQRNEDRLALLAPQGTDALAQTLALDEEQRQRLSQQLDALPPTAEDVPSLAVADAEQEQEQRQLKAAEREHANYHTQLQLAEQATRTASEELDSLEQRLESPAYQETKNRAQEQLHNLQQQQQHLEKSLADRQQQIAAANPHVLRQDIQRLSTSADNLERLASQRALEIRELESKLEVLGGQGLEETRAEQAAALEQHERRCAELSRRAEALGLLLQLLRDKRQALTRRLQEPLQRHLNHYLQLLFPNARLEVDDDLVPRQLVRTSDTAVGEFDALSFGAREQMGLISRLAYADLLKEAGRPTLIILDDALVHSDSQRLTQMKRILFDAAQRHQILLFTCHPENWRDLGVTPRELDGLRSMQL